MQDRCRWN